MSNSAINTQVAQLKIGNVQNQADSTGVYSNGVWSFKNSTALTSVTITDSGNVGIGVTPSSAPTGSLFVKRSISGADTTPFVLYHNSTLNAAQTADTYINNGTASRYYQNAGAHIWQTAVSGIAGNSITWSDVARIDASGNLLVGTTASVYASDKVAVENTSNSAAVALGLKAQSRVLGFVIRNSSGTYQEFFCQGTNTTTGSITTNGTTTAYNPSSDERLKENIEPLTNALAAIKKLQPRKYTWKSSGVADDGFIAQELQQIPEFAHRVNPIGERDGEVYYGVDYMRFVSYLTAAIQELSAKVDAQAAEIEALKAK